MKRRSKGKGDNANYTTTVPQEDEFEEVEVEVKYKTVTTQDWERVNANVAVWARDKDEVTDEEYQNFYKVSCARVQVAYRGLLPGAGESTNHYQERG